jgi:uncharacterized caspase-like protein
VALVVGNGGYRWEANLQNPRRDARAMGLLLEAMGLRTEVLLDADRATMLAALDRLRGRASGAGTALLFFAGHGIQRRGENWLVPVDADLQSGTEAARQLVGFRAALEALGPAAQRVVVLDACRDDPLAGGGEATRGLARIEEAPAGTLVCFATSPGRVALDGTGQHSPFSDALLEYAGTPGLELRQVLTRVRRRVLLATDGQQVPWDTSSLTSDVLLREAGLAPVPRPNLNPPPPAPAPAPARQGQGRQPARVLPPQPDMAPPVAQEVRFDPARYREIPLTYAHAAAAPLPLPEGLLVERRNAEGEETPWAGGYATVNGLLVVLSTSVARKRAIVILSGGFSQHSRRIPGWWQSDAFFENGVLSQYQNRSLLRRWDLTTGWAMALNNQGPEGRVFAPASFRITRIE